MVRGQNRVIKLMRVLLVYEIFGLEDLKKPAGMLFFCPQHSAWTRAWKRRDWVYSQCSAKDPL